MVNVFFSWLALSIMMIVLGIVTEDYPWNEKCAKVFVKYWLLPGIVSTMIWMLIFIWIS